MSRLNQKTSYKPEVKYGLSGNGNLQVEKTDVQKLMEYVASFIYGENSFYESADEKMAELTAVLARIASRKGGDKVIADTLDIAKNEFGMRTMPVVALVEYLKAARAIGRQQVDGTRQLVDQMIRRVDDMTDMYSYALKAFGAKNQVPLAIKRGIADAFNKFDAYQLGKYNRDGAVKLKDLLRITHPTPKSDVLADTFAKIMADALESPDTWEVELSRNGQLPASERRSPAVIWAEFIKERKLGMLAMLRNLRNMQESGVFRDYPETVALVADNIRKPSKLTFPHQYYAAYRMAENVPAQIKNALKDAINQSALSNIPVIGENVWVIVDCSGSMEAKSSQRSVTTMKDVAALFGASVALRQKVAGKKVVLTAFADRSQGIPVKDADNVFDIVERVSRLYLGGGTNLEDAVNNVKAYWGATLPDTVVVISDMQINQLTGGYNGFYSWQITVQPHGIAKKLSFAKNRFAVILNSEITTPVSSVVGFHQLTGYSDSIFKYIDVIRNFDQYLSRITAR
jgi:hypothetical protein